MAVLAQELAKAIGGRPVRAAVFTTYVGANTGYSLIAADILNNAREFMACRKLLPLQPDLDTARLADPDVPPTTKTLSTGEHSISSWSPEIDNEWI